MKLGPIEIFRAGSWTDMSGKEVTVTDADIAAIARSYDVDSAPAPAVIGHPTNNAPAYAWADRVAYTNGKLTATLKDAAAEFVEWVRAGRYRKVSVALYPPNASNNPSPGTYYLRHIGFLGGAAPAVAGLAPVGFADDGSGALVFGDEQAGRDRAALNRERAAFERERDEHRMERLLSEGRLLPIHKAETLSFLSALDGENTFAFADGRKETQRDWFLSFLDRMPKFVEYGSLPKDDKMSARQAERTAKTPKGYAISPEDALLFSQASELAERESITLAEAASRLSREG